MKKTSKIVMFCVAAALFPLVSGAGTSANGDEIIFRSFDAGAGEISYVIHRYLTAGDGGNFTPPGGVAAVDYLVVAGGGGGGNQATGGGGGGGAGGLKTGSLTEVAGGDYQIVVGAGGAALQDGGLSSALGVSTTGGGAGAGGIGTSENTDGGNDGGSGGGGRGQTHNVLAGSGTDGEGHNGGSGFGGGDVDGQRIGGGGGGAGSSGGGANHGNLWGGAGLMSDIDGIERWYAGGGGGGGRHSYAGGAGGSGVGGAGGGGTGKPTNRGGDGAPNTGSGGGGGGALADTDSGAGGSGGAGIVVLRYQLAHVSTMQEDEPHIAFSGNVQRLLIEDTVTVRVPETETLSILAGGELYIGGDAELDADGATVTLAAGARLGGGGVFHGGLTLADNAEFAFDPDKTLTVNGTLDLGNLSVARLVGLTEDVELKTYTLIAGDKTNWTFSGMGNLGEENKVEIGDSGKFAYFEAGSLQLVVIPEPHTLGLLLAAGALLAVRRRRR